MSQDSYMEKEQNSNVLLHNETHDKESLRI